MSETGKVDHSFDEDSNWFIRQISSRKRVLPTFAHACRTITDRTEKDLDKLIESHAKDKTYDEQGRLETYVVEEGFAKRHAILQRAFDDFAIFSVSLPKMAVVSVVSLFDAFLSRTLRNVYKAKPEILNSCTRQITFTELMQFGSIENAREFIIDKEIETLLRDSHIAQFEWLSKRLDVKLTNLPSWKDFVELTERRNLLVHADGRASAHYIDTCKKYEIKVDPTTIPGTRLNITPEYYRNACNCVAEIGLKLVQVLWRKLLPSELEDAEGSYIEICYDLLIQHDYKLAEKMLSLTTEKAFKKVNAESSLYMTINLAISFKGQEKLKELNKLLDTIDFSPLSSKFKLASLVLTDKYDDAADLMRKIGNSEEVSEVNYTEWPLFRWFRKTDQFKSAFKDIYGRDFVIVKGTLSLDEMDDSDLVEVAEMEEESESAQIDAQVPSKNDIGASDNYSTRGCEPHGQDQDHVEVAPANLLKGAEHTDADLKTLNQ
ncbi:hypothetical protein [Pseudomonas sp.]|uniref:hypothetical protein n=1 Tax=Pseudomonas sp. TaxID=306 RepID=UPI0028A99939|nr:hypothetical protein [Pseudomonas sp.]